MVVVTKQLCDQLSDKEIVKNSLANIDYFICLYYRYEKRLLHYIKRISGISNEQAEDILQDSFIKIWQNLNDFDQRMKLSSWIYRIVHNETISQWRNEKHYGKSKKVKFEENLSKHTLYEFDNKKDVDKMEFYTHEVLYLLPMKYKSVLILKFIEGMSYQEISDVLKISEGTVATRINRAKKRFLKEASENHISFNN